jgi:periplasmic protein CpxP/Spy
MRTRITTAAFAAALLLLGGASVAGAQTSSGAAPANGAGVGSNSPSNVAAQPKAPAARQDQSVGEAATGSSGSSSPQQSGNGKIAPGANSFTEAQAKSRIESMGYQQVTNLKKDPSTSVWTGNAMKNGKHVQVQLDYQGDVAAK